MIKYDYAIIGLGQTGYSCVEYLLSQSKSFFVLDDRTAPPYLAALKEHHPGVELHLGEVDAEVLLQAGKIIISPGLPLTHPWVVAAKAKSIPVLTDISLFMDQAKAPIVLVTGSNGKSTVVKLVGHLASARFKLLIGGNYGIPALDLLKEPVPDYYVLELSSFQLISTDNIHSFAATVLNITPNHLDWHASMEEYAQAKLKIYCHCQHPVVLESVYTLYPKRLPAPKNAFTLDAAQEVILFNHEKLCATSELPVPGNAYYPNVLAAFNLAYHMGVPVRELVAGVKTFKGLPYRCELIATEQGCYWYNDSKATTLEAVIAAVKAVKSKHDGRIILILSGLTKGVDLKPLKSAIADKIDRLILLGQAARVFEALFSETPCCLVQTMCEAVRFAKEKSQAGDVVLFSPAGASFDLFKNYQHRGDVFSATVKEVLCLNKITTTNS